VIDINPEQRKVILRNEALTYDSLIITGVSHHYFGNDDWEKKVPGLKTVENALEKRRCIVAFEAAEADPENAVLG